MLMGGIEPPVNENYSQTSCARDSLVVSQVNHVLDTISAMDYCPEQTDVYVTVYFPTENI